VHPQNLGLGLVLQGKTQKKIYREAVDNQGNSANADPADYR
jgi:hypothetical protein